MGYVTFLLTQVPNREVLAGSAHTVRWATAGIPTNAKISIELYSDVFILADKKHVTVAMAAANTGSFEWQVPTNLDVGDKYYLTLGWVEYPWVTADTPQFALLNGE
jgi:hypothetical protein